MAGSGISIRLRRRLKALLGIETLQQRVATLEAALLDARAAAEAQTAANAKALALANQRLVTLGEQVAAARAIADRATARLAEADGQLAAIDRQLGDGRAA